MISANDVQLRPQRIDVTLLGATIGAGVKIEMAHVKLNSPLGEFMLSSLELDKLFALSMTGPPPLHH